tara:strand:+ start:4937 stop:6664 length:1728 start_codon:yes stop_codon:yes gene_type:complete
MADSFSDIMGDYENKSLEELGSSLLSRQAQINEDNAKEAKKSQRVGQALALIGVGQKVFKNAYNKRADELDKQELFLLSNNDSEAKEIAQLGRIMQYMPEKEWADKNKNLDIDSKVKLYLEEYDGDGLSVKFKPVIDGLIKQEIGEENFNAFKGNTDTYDTAYDTALSNVLKEYLKNDVDGNANYLSFEDELRNTLQLDKDMDRLDVFKRARGLKAYDLTQAEKRLIAERKSLYRNRGAMNVIKDGFAQVGSRNEKNGGINVFKNIESTNLAGGNLSDILNNLDLGGIVIGSVDESMTAYRNTFDSLTDLAKADTNLYDRASKNLAQFDSLIRKQKIYDNDNKYKMTIGRRSWGRYVDDILTDEAQKDAWITDIAGMSLAFKKDTDFAERVYRGGLANKGMEVSEEEIQEFRNKIKRSDKFRLDIATAITAQQGFKKGGGSINPIKGLNAAEYYDVNTDEKIYETYQYDRYKGQVPAVLGEGIKFDTNKEKYVTDESWETMSKKAKQSSFDLKFKEIATSKNISIQQKNQMFELLYNQIPNPYDLNYEEYLETVAPGVVQEVNKEFTTKQLNSVI